LPRWADGRIGLAARPVRRGGATRRPLKDPRSRPTLSMSATMAIALFWPRD
jgi:hypothetical protein